MDSVPQNCGTKFALTVPCLRDLLVRVASGAALHHSQNSTGTPARNMEGCPFDGNNAEEARTALAASREGTALTHDLCLSVTRLLK